jgi:phosphate:Na+ symporter
MVNVKSIFLRNFIVITLVCFFCFNKIYAVDYTSYSLQKPQSSKISNFSGDKQSQAINLDLEKPIRVKVMAGDTTPIVNHAVYFEVISTPKKAKKYRLQHDVVYTDKDGIAMNHFKLGNIEGEYLIAARIDISKRNSVLVFSETARKSNWVFMLIAGLLGGLGLFLFGINVMSEGLQNFAGSKMRTILSKLTHNTLVGASIGVFVTTIIQSSSATSVMMIRFVQSRLMQFKQTIGVIIGAALGTTITLQIIAFNISEYSLFLIALGFILKGTIKNPHYKHLGQTLFGLGILFFGLQIMSGSIGPLKSFSPFIDFLIKMENPFLGILVGTIFTGIFQSASAFIGILIILASQGLMNLEAGIPLMLGANLGTSITAILASVGTSTEAKKVAFAHTFYRVFGIILICWWIPYFSDIVKYVSPKAVFSADKFAMLAEVAPRQIANAHTLFYIGLTILSIPLVNFFKFVVDRLVPDRPIKHKEEFTLHLIDESLIGTPSLAITLAKQEVNRMGCLVREMVTEIIVPFFEKNADLLPKIQKQEKEINFLNDHINDYLVKITKGHIPGEQINEAFQLMYITNEFEQIADVVAINLYEKAKEWIDNNYEFSEEGEKELKEFHLHTLKQISRSIEVFTELNLVKAKHMIHKKEKYSKLALELERHHFERLQHEVEKSISSSRYHIELIGIFKFMNQHSTNIAKILLSPLAMAINADDNKEESVNIG